MAEFVDKLQAGFQDIFTPSTGVTLGGILGGIFAGEIIDSVIYKRGEEQGDWLGFTVSSVVKLFGGVVVYALTMGTGKPIRAVGTAFVGGVLASIINSLSETVSGSGIMSFGAAAGKVLSSGFPGVSRAVGMGQMMNNIQDQLANVETPSMKRSLTVDDEEIEEEVSM